MKKKIKIERAIKSKNIVLLHGWGGSNKKLQPLSSELSSLRWWTFLPEIPGFDSSPPEEVWGVSEYVDYVLREADKFFEGKNYFVFGHSFGGRIAIRIGSENSLNLAGVILCASAGISRGNIIKRLVFFFLAKFGKVLLLTPKLANTWRKLLYKLAREHDYEKTQGIMKDIFRKVVSENLRDRAQKIQLPTLVLWGRQDRMTPVSDAFYIKRVLPKAKLVIFKNEGHRLPYNKPKEVAGKIDRWYKSLK